MTIMGEKAAVDEATAPVSYVPCSATTYCNSFNFLFIFGGDNYLHR